ncbi:hypothetical protein BT63DRAFT_455090 [Microthyrium microscopicum]|uniref:Uncharacterized protein n=1 Tax=Microthyrium microscopicum TaxID=703497 RepID=A0A6A6UCE4_9PEZI|nr:hypothetical protein BT63DRAFT_455090 [Microthyrium microscopicum]
MSSSKEQLPLTPSDSDVAQKPSTQPPSPNLAAHTAQPSPPPRPAQPPRTVTPSPQAHPIQPPGSTQLPRSISATLTPSGSGTVTVPGRDEVLTFNLFSLPASSPVDPSTPGLDPSSQRALERLAKLEFELEDVQLQMNEMEHDSRASYQFLRRERAEVRRDIEAAAERVAQAVSMNFQGMDHYVKITPRGLEVRYVLDGVEHNRLYRRREFENHDYPWDL